MVTSLPPQVGRGFERGGEVAGESGQVRKAAPGGGCEPASAGHHVLHAAAGGIGQPEVPLCLGQVVDSQVVQARGQRAGGGHSGEAFRGATAVLVLPAGKSGEGFHQRFGGGLQFLVAGLVMGGWREGLPGRLAKRQVRAAWR